MATWKASDDGKDQKYDERREERKVKKLLVILGILVLVLAGSGVAANVNPASEENPGSDPPLEGDSSKVYAVMLKGDPEERGKQYGEQVKDAVVANIEFFLEAALEQGLSLEDILIQGREYEEILRQETPNLVAEIKGLAETSGVSYETLLAFNLLEEEILGGECTIMLATGAATRDGGIYFHKNRDARRGVAQVVIQVEPAEGYKFIAITSAGSTGISLGINEKGVSTGNNALYTWDRGKGLGNLTINRRILEQAASAREAVELIEGWDRRSGSCYNVADTEEAAFVEATHSAVAVMWVVDDAVAHTNHYIIPGMEIYETIFDPNDSTYIRLERANELLQADWGHLTIRHLIGISEDRIGEIGNNWIDRQANGTGTISAGTFDHTKLRMWVQLGQPSIAPEIPLDVDRPLIPGPFATGQFSEIIEMVRNLR